MRRAVARGRVFAQRYSTDRRYGRISLKACALFPLMWSNADDQGRLSGDPEEIKYTCCPNIDHITKADIPAILQDLHENSLILLYTASNTAVIQLLDWWQEHQRLQWAWPSEYPASDGWQDRLRYKRGAKEVVTENWSSQVSTQVTEDNSPGEAQVSTQVRADSAPAERSGEHDVERFPHPPNKDKEKVEGGGRGGGNRNSPERSGEKLPSPSPTGDLITDSSELLSELTYCFRYRWGRVPAQDPYTVIPREPDPRESAQLRDFAEEISAAGGLPRGFIKKAFDEAIEHEKTHISYMRAILLDWLGIERERSDEPREA